MELKSLNALYDEEFKFDEKDKGCFYYTNAVGEINVPGKPPLYCGQAEELPPYVRSLYERYQTEGVAAPVYTMNVCGVVGMGIGFLIPISNPILKERNDISDDWKYKLCEMAAADLAAWLSAYETPDVTVFLGRNTAPEGSEVLVFIPKIRCEELLGDKCQLADANMEKVWAKGDEFLAARLSQSAKLTIAIDGPVAAGKTTQAKELAKHLGLTYCDTGAMYRGIAVGLDAYRKAPDASLEETVRDVLPSLTVEVKSCDGRQVTLLNGKDVTGRLRTEKISRLASDASAIPEIRAHLLKLQRDIASRGGVVMEGRDIGTVVMPAADVKIFLTAPAKVRAKRRYDEHTASDAVSFDEVLKNLQERDANDMGRENAPLKQADDAVLLSNAELGIQKTTDAIFDIILRHM